MDLPGLESCINLGMWGSLNGISEIKGGWEFGIDSVALAWLTVTSILIFVGPALISLVYLYAQDSANQELRTAAPTEQQEEHKTAA
jgi:hypothetical protein